jgi:hypothetical protein
MNKSTSTTQNTSSQPLCTTIQQKRMDFYPSKITTATTSNYQHLHNQQIRKQFFSPVIQHDAIKIKRMRRRTIRRLQQIQHHPPLPQSKSQASNTSSLSTRQESTSQAITNTPPPATINVVITSTTATQPTATTETAVMDNNSVDTAELINNINNHSPPHTPI